MGPEGVPAGTGGGGGGGAAGSHPGRVTGTGYAPFTHSQRPFRTSCSTLGAAGGKPSIETPQKALRGTQTHNLSALRLIFI